MSIDSLIANPGRLRILTALATEPRQEFVNLRKVTKMTDGNLATHARRLAIAGMLDVDKSFRDGKPVTTFTLTTQGRDALQSHVDRLIRAISTPTQPEARPSNPEPVATVEAESEETWID